MNPLRSTALAGVVLAQVWSSILSTPAAVAQEAIPISTAPTTATVRGSGVVIRSAPDMASPVLVEVAPGAALSVTGTGQKTGYLGWWEVLDPATGTRGWLRWEYLASDIPGQFHPDGPPTPTPTPVAPTPLPVPTAIAAPNNGEVAAPVPPEPAPDGNGQTNNQNKPDPTIDELVLDATGDVNRFWRQVVKDAGGKWAAPGVVPYEATIATGCNSASPGNGPFFCPADQLVYLDIPFIEGVAGSESYIVGSILAHEWTHYVMWNLGIAASQYPELTGGLYSIQTELHADCVSGSFMAWNVSRSGMDQDDASRAAEITAIVAGDPAWVPPDSYGAHGTAEERFAAIDFGYSSFGGEPLAAFLACGQKYIG